MPIRTCANASAGGAAFARDADDKPRLTLGDRRGRFEKGGLQPCECTGFQRVAPPHPRSFRGGRHGKASRLDPDWPTWQGFTPGPGLASKIDALPFAPHRAALQSSITVKNQMFVLDWTEISREQNSCKKSDSIKISIARQIHVLRVWSEEQNAWIRAIRRCAQKHGETALLRPRSAKATLYECHRALVRLYSHPQMLRPCWPLAG
jgi:hypothetical protein